MLKLQIGMPPLTALTPFRISSLVRQQYPPLLSSPLHWRLSPTLCSATKHAACSRAHNARKKSGRPFPGVPITSTCFAERGSSIHWHCYPSPTNLLYSAILK
nr:hypothetical protein BgiMline_003458 [Biomphalaria glabrata]